MLDAEVQVVSVVGGPESGVDLSLLDEDGALVPESRWRRGEDKSTHRHRRACGESI